MNISVIGSGYVGLVTGVCLADFGHHITLMDVDKEKIEKLKKGLSPIYEPGLEELMKKNKNIIEYTTSLNDAIKDVIFLCLPTPTKDNGEADTSYIFEVSEKLSKIIKDDVLIVVKSTVPVGTCKQLKGFFDKADIVSNPEFLREGNAIYDFMNPDRIVIGVENERSRKIMEKVYIKQKDKIIFMDLNSAEMTKYASNAFLALKISFINEVAQLCEKTGANINYVKKGVGSDKRIGEHFLSAGIGWGGSCFPKDTSALIKIGEKHGLDMKIIKAARKVNYNQRSFFVNKILNHYKDLNGKTLAVLGLAFKPNTDDMRDAPSIDIIRKLLKYNAKINAYDPAAINNAKKIFGDKVCFKESVYDAVKDVDGVIILTEWDEFVNMDLEKVKNLVKNRVIFDGRNCIKIEKDFIYYGIGLN